MTDFRPLVPLLTAAGILLAGNGLQGTMIALRGAEEGFSTGQIGFMGTCYFAGFILACFATPRMLAAVGHIRTFAALAATAASGTLAIALWLGPYPWMVIRFVMGFCFSGLFTTMESWLNTGVPNSERGRVLSVYRMIDLGAVTGSQYLLPLLGSSDFRIFSVMAIMVTISLVPVSLADRSNPKPPEEFRFDIPQMWRISPLASIGCVVIGMTNSAFRLIGPVYARDLGFSDTGIANFISASIIGAAVMQYPFGWWSDRHGRRIVLLFASIGAVAAGLYLTMLAGGSHTANLVGVFFFGAFALPLYSLSAAHANDRAKEGQYVLVAAGLMFFYSVGAMAGPFVASLLMEWRGPAALFSFTSAVHAVLIAATLWRMRARGPADRRGRFAAVMRTSPLIFRLARKRGEAERNGGK